MEINFRTKEGSNKIQREKFLELTPVQRIYAFFDLMYMLKDYPVTKIEERNDNFLIVIKDD